MSEVETRHRKQLAVMRGFLEGRQFFNAARAMETVRQLEQGYRKDGSTPKFHHQLSVARLTATLLPHLMFPEATLTAAFLHDTIEDHGDVWSKDRIRDEFGSQVAEAVWALSKKTVGLVKTSDEYYGGLGRCPIGSIVKLADRAHNVQTMQGVFNLEKQRQYVAEVESKFFPMVRVARRSFPSQYQAYENLKIILRCQLGILKTFHVQINS